MDDDGQFRVDPPGGNVNPGDQGCHDDADVERVLEYWFGDPGGVPFPADRRSLWFKGSPQVDTRIRAEFGELVTMALGARLHGWRETLDGLLALVLLLDQFPRNIYRGTARAYDGDAQALELVTQAVRTGIDGQLRTDKACFLYMPLEHSESLADQTLCVQLMVALEERADSPAERKAIHGFLDYARQHRDLIAKFGRFPHRNQVLGRVSTAREQAYLAAGNRSFNQ